MPVYCYECEVCGAFEASQSIHDEPLTLCPSGHPAKKVLAPVQMFMRESEKASYFAGREGNQRLDQQMMQNQCVADGVKRGEYVEPKRGESQPMSMFNDLERRIKE